MENFSFLSTKYFEITVAQYFKFLYVCIRSELLDANIRDNNGELASEKLPEGSFFIKHFVSQQEVSERSKEINFGISISFNYIKNKKDAKDKLFLLFKRSSKI